MPVVDAKLIVLIILLLALLTAIEPLLPTVKLAVPLTFKEPELVMALAVALLVVTLKVPLIVEPPKLIVEDVPLIVALPVIPAVVKLMAPP